VGGTKCFMMFMVLNTNGYKLLMGLDFLMKIGNVVDVERPLIRIKNGPNQNRCNNRTKTHALVKVGDRGNKLGSKASSFKKIHKRNY
jgi:hypothetical protein